LLIQRLGAPAIAKTCERLGAPGVRVLRGVEDGKAFERGLVNTATADGLATLLRAVASGAAPGAREIVALLELQEFRAGIPAGVPKGTRVANKTGRITAVSHDAAIVLPAGRKPYVLVVLTRGFPSWEKGDAAIAAVSAAAWKHVAK
jgi:beta-lactamase class A